MKIEVLITNMTNNIINKLKEISNPDDDTVDELKTKVLSDYIRFNSMEKNRSIVYAFTDEVMEAVKYWIDTRPHINSEHIKEMYKDDDHLYGGLAFILLYDWIEIKISAI